MKLTKALRDHLLQKGWVTAEADEKACLQIVGAKLLTGDLTAAQLTELTKDVTPAFAPPSPPAPVPAPTPSPTQKALEAVDERIAAALAPVTAALTAMGGSIKQLADRTPAPPAPPAPPPATAPTAADVDLIVQRSLTDLIARAGGDAPAGGGMPGILTRHAGMLYRPEVRVKAAVEQYAHARTRALFPERTKDGFPHPMAGGPASSPEGVELDHPSQRDLAVSGAVFKWQLERSSDRNLIPRHLRMTDHDRDLVFWALHNEKWTGYIGGDPSDDLDPGRPGEVRVNRRLLTDLERKAVLDDTISGGIEVVPVVLDDTLITYPVLFGEVFPLVTVINLPRGRRVKGGIISNPTFTSGIPEGTAITPFNTANFISAFDTTIYNAVSAIEIGLDFEDDSPAPVGQLIQQKYGEKALEWLDRVICMGDGVTEPEGIFISTAPVVVNSDMNVAGPPTVGDYEGLMFALPKQYRNARGGRNVYIASDTSYRRARAIAVGPGDERRIFGMNQGDYRLLDSPFKVCNAIPNSSIAFVNLAFYRMYRRLGLNMRVETGGQALALRNTRLIVVRMRYGGRLELGNSAAVIKDSWL